jgi:hypothetical protein
MRHIAAALLTLCAACAHLEKMADPEEAKVHYREQVLFDLDLTQGSAGNGQVTGGKFDGGWRASSPSGERIVWDAGRPLANGYFEVSYVMSKPPHPTDGKHVKIDWVGLHEGPLLDQDKYVGDIFYARVGDPKFRYSRIKAYGRQFDKSEWENDIGKAEDWVTDGKTVQTVKLEWKNGRAVFHDAHGNSHKCPKSLCSPSYPIDKIRYAYVGSDKYTNLTLPGIRYTHVKLVELLR